MIPCPDHRYEDVNRCSQCRSQRGKGKPNNFDEIFRRAREQERIHREHETQETDQP